MDFIGVAYQAEGDLVRMVAPHYKRADDEGRTLVQSALTGAADIEVTETELRVILAPLSSAHRTRAIAALCEELDRTPVCFPGTLLHLRFAVAQPAGPAVDKKRTDQPGPMSGGLESGCLGQHLVGEFIGLQQCRVSRIALQPTCAATGRKVALASRRQSRRPPKARASQIKLPSRLPIGTKGWPLSRLEGPNEVPTTDSRCRPSG